MKPHSSGPQDGMRSCAGRLNPAPWSIYVHIPFCSSRCAYCDFPTFAGRDDEIPSYVQALVHQIRGTPFAGQPARTLYVGGGTPTHLTVKSLKCLMEAFVNTFAFLPEAEVSIEANPGTVTRQSLAAIRRLGFTRISIGIQALDDALLATLGRAHTANAARTALRDARSAGFRSVSADLIYGIPGQTLRQWQATLAETVSLGVDHISAYCLALEEGTALYEAVGRGEVTQVDEDSAADMFEATMDTLFSLGFEHYEISNFARPGHRCLHNLSYWRNESYLGFGAAAASYVAGERSVAVRDPGEFCRRVWANLPLTETSERLPPERALGEALMLAVRMLDGFCLKEMSARYGAELVERVRPVLATLQHRGLLACSGSRIRLTRKGILFADDVASELMAGTEGSLRADSNR